MHDLDGPIRWLNITIINPPDQLCFLNLVALDIFQRLINSIIEKDFDTVRDPKHVMSHFLPRAHMHSKG